MPSTGGMAAGAAEDMAKTGGMAAGVPLEEEPSEQRCGGGLGPTPLRVKGRGGGLLLVRAGEGLVGLGVDGAGELDGVDGGDVFDYSRTTLSTKFDFSLYHVYSDKIKNIWPILVLMLEFLPSPLERWSKEV